MQICGNDLWNSWYMFLYAGKVNLSATFLVQTSPQGFLKFLKCFYAFIISNCQINTIGDGYWIWKGLFFDTLCTKRSFHANVQIVVVVMIHGILVICSYVQKKSTWAPHSSYKHQRRGLLMQLYDRWLCSQIRGCSSFLTNKQSHTGNSNCLEDNSPTPCRPCACGLVTYYACVNRS